jgi:hypothetical protein
MFTSRRRHSGESGTVIGPDLVANGSFASGASWTTGTGWTIGTGVATAVATGASALSQTGGIPALVAGKTYRVSFTITAQNVAGDGVGWFLGAIGSSGAARTGVGTYTENIVCGAGTTFQFNAKIAGAWEGSIDNVSVRQVGF